MYHIPVLKNECVKAFSFSDKKKLIVDTTLGGGGHSEGILINDPNAYLICIDQDFDAINYAKNRLIKFEDRITFIKGNFGDLRTLLALEKIKKIDGILYDLGISSYQIDEASRGFSFGKDAILDMRMDNERKISALEIINNYSLNDLTNIFKMYGEEKLSYKIAKQIINRRKERKITTTLDLSKIIENVVNSKNVIKTKARIFQAVRIEVNDEINVLKRSLNEAVDLLNEDGVIAVITYHSLEDRIVKNLFKVKEKGCICDISVPICNCDVKQTLKLINKKPILPTKEEIHSNVRARSAKLRIAKKI